jgi:hypothetical protein
MIKSNTSKMLSGVVHFRFTNKDFEVERLTTNLTVLLGKLLK